MAKGITETVGLDVGDRFTRYSILSQESGEEVGSGRVRSTPEGVRRLLGAYPGARVVLEAGTHSRWISHTAERCCAEVLVANPRKLRFIYQNDRKSDEVDARALARVGRLDTTLLAPIQHRSDAAQRDLAVVRARAGLVEARTKLVNTLRGIVKSFGFRLPALSTSQIGRKTLELIPEEIRPALHPLLLSIEALTHEIGTCDKRVDVLAEEAYPETRQLTQVPGVGNLTALAYLLTIEDVGRFRSSRSAGAFLGLVPRRDQSGDVEKQLPISKAGDRLVRTLLVQCAQRILGRKGVESDLRRHGMRIASRGGPTAKKRAVIAVARKLAVLLHSLWRTGEAYEPLRNSGRAA